MLYNVFIVHSLNAGSVRVSFTCALQVFQRYLMDGFEKENSFLPRKLGLEASTPTSLVTLALANKLVKQTSNSCQTWQRGNNWTPAW